MPNETFFEDLRVGQTLTTGSYAVSADEIMAFGRQYDPQPAHVDAVAAEASVFGRLVASGWQTAAITMRLLVDSELFPADGSVGAGVDSLRWTRPVGPGDVLHLEISVAELRPSRSRSDRGIVKLDIRTLNAAGETVQTLLISSLVARRAPASA